MSASDPVTSATVAKVNRANLDRVRRLTTTWEATGREGYYLREIEGNYYLFHYSEGELGAAPSSMVSELERLIEPLPTAADHKRRFEPMERVFFYSGAADKRPEEDVVRIAMFTGLRLEKEKDYRLLHSNPWPDVLAAIRRANLRNFSIFLEEIDGKLYLFGWLEYVGSDLEADNATNKKDPASIRWWKETDACQLAPADAKEGMWGAMDELFFTEP